ncbi:hypothetical protein [Actinoplanes sp. NPDC051851]|uniref:hypothetical protein n=1 Tax=Actinoplanes sp. NPDC051851 TaxID=3154753 RepID=UPI00341ACC37
MTVVATLVVEGPPRALATVTRTYAVTVDGVTKGRVRAGRTLELALPPGSHTVQARDGGHTGPPLPVHLGPGRRTRLRIERDGAGKPHLTPLDAD